MKKYLPLIIFVVVLTSLSAWGYKVFHKRYENLPQSKQENSNLSSDIQAQQNNIQSSDSTNTGSTDSEPNDNEETPPEDAIPEKNNYLDINKSDCENKCKDFTTANELKYCQQYCGINAVVKPDEKKGCDALKDLDKDYCLKDYAVSKEDVSLCEKIEDTGIKKTCREIITQELINVRDQQ